MRNNVEVDKKINELIQISQDELMPGEKLEDVFPGCVYDTVEINGVRYKVSVEFKLRRL